MTPRRGKASARRHVKQDDERDDENSAGEAPPRGTVAEEATDGSTGGSRTRPTPPCVTPGGGNEFDLYDRCANLVPQTWSEVVRLGGVELVTLGRPVVDAYPALRSTVLPPRLGQRRLRVVYGPSNQVQVTC